MTDWTGSVSVFGRTSRVVPVPLIGFLLVVMLLVLPILAHPFLPLTDLPNHIARHHIAATEGRGELADFYSYKIRLVPNAAADLLWLALGFPGDVIRFSQLVMAFYAAAMVGAAMVLARQVHGHWTLWSAVSGLVVYNACFFWGFQNFLVGMPFAVLGLALWIATERWRLGLRLALFLVCGAALYVMHFYAFASLGLMAFGREAQRVLEAPRGRRLRQFGSGLAMAVPFIVPVGWLVLSILSGPASPAGSQTEFGPWLDRGEALMSATLPLGPDLGWPTDLAARLALVFIAVCLMTLLRPSGARLRLAPVMRGPLVALTLAAVLAPSWLNGVAYSHIRLPFVVVVLAIAASDWQGLSRKQALRLAALGVMLIAFRGVAFERAAAAFSVEIADLQVVLHDVPAGARVLPLRSPGNSPDRTHWHVQAYAVTMRDGFVPTLFQGVHAIRVLPQWQDASHPQLFGPDIRYAQTALQQPVPIGFLNRWPEKFTMALLLDDDRTMASAMPNLQEVTRQGRFTLYRIQSDATGISHSDHRP